MFMYNFWSEGQNDAFEKVVPPLLLPHLCSKWGRGRGGVVMLFISSVQLGEKSTQPWFTGPPVYMPGHTYSEKPLLSSFSLSTLSHYSLYFFSRSIHFPYLEPLFFCLGFSVSPHNFLFHFLSQACRGSLLLARHRGQLSFSFTLLSSAVC